MRLKRYEELPSQFIPKHNQKYLMRRTLVNTKFQWLMKYLAHQTVEQNNSLSKVISIEPKQTFNCKDKQQIKKALEDQARQSKYQFENKQGNKMTPSLSANLKSRRKFRTNSEGNDQTIFLQKTKIRNKSLLMQRSQSKRSTFYQKQKQNRKTFTQKYRKTHQRHRGKTDNFVNRKQFQNFVLTPWALGEQNMENNDF